MTKYFEEIEDTRQQGKIKYEESIYNARFFTPPDWIAEIDHIIAVDRFNGICNFRTYRLVILFFVSTA